jgi:hypothetical protein
MNTNLVDLELRFSLSYHLLLEALLKHARLETGQLTTVPGIQKVPQALEFI